MANRQRGFGLTAELDRKKEAKFDADLANECFDWMKAVLKNENLNAEAAQIDGTIEKSGDVAPKLKDGVILCKLVNCIIKDTEDADKGVKKINTSTMAFKTMENIGNFLKACEAIGCQKLDLFQTVDLHESANIPQVINGIVALGRRAQTIGYKGATLGPVESTENKREFSEEQMQAGKNIIGLQAGTNQFASQAGQNFGKTRSIMD